jgi:biopolymer transport protein TolR
MSEINVTPFVDVMLVLLIIFMVAAPLLTVGVPIELPRTAATALPTEPEEPLTVALTAEGTILVQDNEIPREEVDPAAAGGGRGADGRPGLPAGGRGRALRERDAGDGRAERQRLHRHRPRDRAGRTDL